MRSHARDASARSNNVAVHVGLARSRDSRRNNAATRSGGDSGRRGGCPTRSCVPTNVGRGLNTVSPNIKRLRHRELCNSVPALLHVDDVTRYWCRREASMLKLDRADVVYARCKSSITKIRSRTQFACKINRKVRWPVGD